MSRIFFILSILFTLIACNNSDQNSGPIFGGETLNVCKLNSASVGDSDTHASTTSVIAQLKPVGEPTHCSFRQTFEFNQRTVDFVLFFYGQLNDCPSGCFSSSACAVVENEEVFLWSSDWLNFEEPLTIPDECPELAGERSGNTSYCNEPVSGKNHDINQEASFLAFEEQQLAETGPFRYCF